MALEIIKIENSPISSNCYILFDKTFSNDCLVVDPGSEHSVDLEHQLQILQLHPQSIILTHEHFDHIWGCNYLLSKYNCRIICSNVCSLAINDAKKNHSLFYNQIGFVVSAANILLEEIGYKMYWQVYDMIFFPALGHTNSGVCFTIGGYLFTGDSLIKGIRTVTKLFTGSKIELVTTIAKIETMKGNGYMVCPGHGEMFDLDTYNTNLAL